MTTLTAEQLNVKFIRFWEEVCGDLYHDNVTGSSFVVRPEDKIEDVINEVRKQFSKGDK